MLAKSDGPNGRERESQNQGETETEGLGEVQREREWKSPSRVLIGIRPWEAIHSCVLFPNPLSSDHLIFILKPVWVGSCYLQTKVSGLAKAHSSATS